MNGRDRASAAETRRAAEAAAWILRCDRGLTPAEQDGFSDWLAADPRHGQLLARERRHWQRLDTLAQWRPEHGDRPNPDLLAPPRRARVRVFAPYVAALAAAAAVGFFFGRRAGRAPPPPRAGSPAAAEVAATRRLPDGTLVELNHAAELSVNFTAAERRVRLEHGEAHFAVAKDSARPFVVGAGGVDVRAVGTVFNVRLGSGAVEVLVTEGRVGVARQEARDLPSAPLQLAARQRAVVPVTPASTPPEVATLTTGEIDRVLAWQHRLLDFTATPLGEVVAEFNRHNVVQIVLTGSELAATRVSASFRTDNVDGFVQLLVSGFGAEVVRRTPDEILLRPVQK